MPIFRANEKKMSTGTVPLYIRIQNYGPDPGDQLIRYGSTGSGSTTLVCTNTDILKLTDLDPDRQTGGV